MEDCEINASYLEEGYLIAEREHDRYKEAKKELKKISKENENLRQQLTEKEHKIEQLKAKLETAEYWNKKYDNLQSQNNPQDIHKKICDKILELCDKKFRSINEFDFVEIISRDELIEILDKIEQEL